MQEFVDGHPDCRRYTFLVHKIGEFIGRGISRSSDLVSLGSFTLAGCKDLVQAMVRMVRADTEHEIHEEVLEGILDVQEP